MQVYENPQDAIELLGSRRQIINKQISALIEDMFIKIQEYGDIALFDFCKEFDLFNVNETNIIVTAYEIENAYRNVTGEQISAIKEAAKNITAYHETQIRGDLLFEKPGVKLELLSRPIERAGIYVPGGKASYPSSVLMNAIPAKVAGVNEIIMATPPNVKGEINPLTLVAADIAGVDVIYKMGGAQAIIAMALGTQTIKKADKIAGPGNVYVNCAKQMVYGYAGIDMLAGPSEILIIADEHADPNFIAADFLSQAEHDENAACILITDSKEIVRNVILEMKTQFKNLEKHDIAAVSLKNYGTIILTKNFEDAADIVNEIAPEHLELLIENPREMLGKIKNAGSVFLGEFSPEPVGDYFAGVNHVLPTNGTARFSSPLCVDDFIKKMSVVEYSREELVRDGKKIICLANAENLGAHANSIRVRLAKWQFSMDVD